MILLDAAFLIAYLEANDRHHTDAVEALLAHPEATLLISPINRAEVLVCPTRTGRIQAATRAFEALGLTDVPLSDDAPTRLAELHATTRLKMPDCCALLAAQQASATLATFDERLRRAAQEHGLETLP